MSLKINSYVLTDDIIELMKQKIIKSKKLTREVGFSLCYDGINNELKADNHCIGNNCSVETKDCKNMKFIGSFHTHPGNTIPSFKDFKNGYKEDIMCIGSQNTINCYTKKQKLIEKGIDEVLLSVEDSEEGSSLIVDNYYNEIQLFKKERKHPEWFYTDIE